MTKAYRAVESEEGSTLERSVITGLTGRDLERDGIRLRQASDVVIRDFDLAMRAEPQTGKHLPEGIAIYAGHNLVIRDGRVRGFRKVVEEGHYTNGDGIATEGAVDGLVIERVTSSDNSDGGFDLKGKNIRLDALIAERNSRNFRFWGDVRAGTLTANGWTSAAVWVGKGATVRIATLTANNDTPAPLLIVETGGSIEIGQCHLKLPAGTSIVKRGGGRNHIVLGPGCGHAGG